MVKTSLARSLKCFVDAITAGDNDPRLVRKIISDSYKIAEDSSQMQLLLFVQLDNFERLLRTISLSIIDDDAKRTFGRQIGALASVVKYPILYSRFDTHAAPIIRSNVAALTYAHTSLEVSYEIDSSLADEIKTLIDQLELALVCLSETNLPLRIRSTLYSQISDLIFLLRNFEGIGLERLWEAGYSNFITIQREAAHIEGAEKIGALKKAAIGIGILLTTLGGVLGALDDGSKHALGFAKNVKEGIEFVERWRRENIPQIEHKKSGAAVSESGNI